MQLVLAVHAFLRWPILAVAILGLAHALAARGVGGGKAWGRPLGAIFLGLLDVQLVLAVILFAEPPLPIGTPRRLHAAAMFLAVLAGHMLRLRQKRLPLERRPPLDLAVFGVPLVLILAGLALLSV